MIVAKLKIQTDDSGHRQLVGRTTSNWPLKVGTLVVLRKRGDEYQLLELGSRERPAGVSEDCLLSFVMADDGEV